MLCDHCETIFYRFVYVHLGIALEFERNLIISILKLTKNRSVLIEDVKKDSRIPLDTLRGLLAKFQSEGLLILDQDSVKVESENRLRLAVKAISLRADVESASSFLQWQEFENISAVAFTTYGYEVVQNLRFKHAARRWEIDLIACRKPLVLCVDCKDFHHRLSPSVMRRVVETQVERVRALANALPGLAIGLECARWDRAKFVPVVLVLIPSRFKFYDEVPIVPILQLQDFLSQLPVEVESLKYFQKDFMHLSHDSEKRSSGELQRRN
jgi:Holliday junction resolvase-like predicted endonuclease